MRWLELFYEVSVNGSLIEKPKISTLRLVPRPACLGIMLWGKVSGSLQIYQKIRVLQNEYVVRS
jgi:hypothetical protein